MNAPGDLNRPHGVAIALMCKPPRPGVSKTRLAALMGEERAALLARAFLLDSADLARSVASGEGARLTGFHTPADAGEEMAALLPGWSLEAQAEGDLGARMEHAFARMFEGGAARALMLGTDAPTLPPGLLQLTLAAIMSGADAACVPALDGGYCCIAMARPLPVLLRGMPWSTAGLLEATRARAAAEGLRFDMLQSWHDVDEAEDLDLLRLTLDGVRLPGCSPLPPYRASMTRAALQA